MKQLKQGIKDGSDKEHMGLAIELVGTEIC